MGGPWPMQTDTFGHGQQELVRYDHSHEFWDAVLGYSYREHNLRALVVDMLQARHTLFPPPSRTHSLTHSLSLSLSTN